MSPLVDHNAIKFCIKWISQVISKQKKKVVRNQFMEQKGKLVETSDEPSKEQEKIDFNKNNEESEEQENLQ